MADTPVILITGASSGIGEAVARLFAHQGYRVALAARRVERLEAVAQAIHSAGGQALVVPADISRLEDIRRLAQRTLESYGQIDILYNNAGFGRMDWLEQLEPEQDVQEQVAVNLTGLIWMAQAVLPHMIERRRGHIMNMASLAGLLAPPTYSVYAATKFGVRGFSEALRREVRMYGIHVSGIYLGGVATEFEQHAHIRRKTGITTPGWLVLSAEQVAQASWRLARRPRHMLVMPWILRPPMWINALAPGFVDWAIQKIYVERERAL